MPDLVNPGRLTRLGDENSGGDTASFWDECAFAVLVFPRMAIRTTSDQLQFGLSVALNFNDNRHAGKAPDRKLSPLQSIHWRIQDSEP